MEISLAISFECCQFFIGVFLLSLTLGCVVQDDDLVRTPFAFPLV